MREKGNVIPSASEKSSAITSTDSVWSYVSLNNFLA